MANNYLQFSGLLPLDSKEEIAWFEDILRCPEDINERRAWAKRHKLTVTATDDNWPGFCYSIKVDKNTDKTDVWFYSEEHGNVEHLALVVQRFLKKFRPDGVWCIEWAEYCSKLRPGEFGGGAVLVTTKSCRYLNTSHWLNLELRKEKAKGKNLTE